MKIAIYSHSIAPSIDGVCRRFTAILHEMVRQGHDTVLFTMEDDPQDLPPSTKTITLDHVIFPSYPNKKVAWPTARAFHAIVATLGKEKPDVIHVVSDGFSNMFTLVGLWLNIPVVGSFHTDILDLLRTHNAFGFQKLIVQTKEAVDSIVLDSCATTSSSFMKKLSQQGVHCEHIIITAVDLNMFHRNKRNEALRLEMMFGDTDGFLCVYVGRISNEKRLDVIINAMRELTGKSSAYLAIVGDGPSAPVYAQMHGKDSRIYCRPRFLSHAELAEVYASSDIHVSASEFETLGNTVLEAFSCNIPVVVPRTQGFRDTVRHETDGFLFHPADSEDARKYIQRLKDDAELRAGFGAQGRQAVSTRTIQYVVEDLFEWYALGSKRRIARSSLQRFASVFILSLLVPTGIFAFMCYNTINALLKPFISFSEYNVIRQKADAAAAATSQASSNDTGKSVDNSASSGSKSSASSSGSGSSRIKSKQK
mmetsp:Transcript_10911/g.17771  ORF Transcript_10911/g.17771 Transcript_10911/m.17771 type:complete len:480 (-) Transcript_10911:429-1868(-)